MRAALPVPPPLGVDPVAVVDPAATPEERRGRLTPPPEPAPPAVPAPTPPAAPTSTPTAAGASTSARAASSVAVELATLVLALLSPRALHGPPDKTESSLPGAAADCHHAVVGLLSPLIEVADPGDSGASASESARGRGDGGAVLDALLALLLLLLLSEEAVARWPRLWAAGGGASVNPFRLASSSLSKASYGYPRCIHRVIRVVGKKKDVQR